MENSTAISVQELAEDDDLVVEPPSGPGARDWLTPQQREFCRQFVANGGNANKAAIDAGYGGGASNMATRNLCKPKLVAEIKRLSIINVGALLPVVIQQLLDIACDVKADPKARVSAAVALLDRGGMHVSRNQPTVAVQVNVNGAQAQTLIEEIWKQKSDREERRQRAYDAVSERIDRKRAKMSDIEDGMPDNSQPAIEGRGGVNLQGPMAVGSTIPAPSTADIWKTAGDDDGAD